MSVEDTVDRRHPQLNWGMLFGSLAAMVLVLGANEYLTDGRNSIGAYMVVGAIALFALKNSRKD